MPSINFNLDLGLQEFKPLLRLLRIGSTRVRNRIVSPTRVEKLADDVFASRIDYGKVVTVQGKLSRYGITYKPLTYAPRISAPFTVTDDGGMQANYQPFQYPVQTLPALEDDNGKYCIAFLYPNTFSGFLLKDDPTKNIETDTHVLLAESQHRGIPVLLSEKDLANTSETEITLTGVITLLPEALIDAITNTLCPTREALYYHFLRTSSPRSGFCIDCRRSENSDFNPQNRLNDLPGALYVEGHFEGVTNEQFAQEYSNSVPKGAFTGAGLGVGFHHPNAPGITLYFSTDEDVSLIRAGAGTFGFYTKTNLADDRDYHRKLTCLREFYNQFRRNVANKIRQTHSFEARFKPDFMFDFSKQYAFHPDGVLSSNTAEQTLRDHPDLNETAEWLRER